LIRHILPSFILGQHDIGGADVAVGAGIGARRVDPILEIPNDIKEDAAERYDRLVGRAEMFARAVYDGAHALLGRQILRVDALNAREGFGFLDLTVDQPIVFSGPVTKGKNREKSSDR